MMLPGDDLLSRLFASTNAVYEPAVKEMAAIAIGDPEVRKDLAYRLIADEDFYHRHRILDVYRQLGERVLDVQGVLQKLLFDPACDKSIRSYIAAILRLAGHRTAAVFLDAIQTGDRFLVGKAIEYVLFTPGIRSQFLEHLKSIMSEEDNDLADSAADAAYCCVKELENVGHFLKHPDPRVQTRFASSMLAEPGEREAELVRLLGSLLDHADPVCRKSAAFALGYRVVNIQSIVQQLLRGLLDSDGLVVRMCASALARAPDPSFEIVSALTLAIHWEHADFQEQWKTRGAIAFALGEMGRAAEPSVETLISLFREAPHWTHCVDVLWALGQIRPKHKKYLKKMEKRAEQENLEVCVLMDEIRVRFTT